MFLCAFLSLLLWTSIHIGIYNVCHERTMYQHDYLLYSMCIVRDSIGVQTMLMNSLSCVPFQRANQPRNQHYQRAPRRRRGEPAHQSIGNEMAVDLLVVIINEWWIFVTYFNVFCIHFSCVFFVFIYVFDVILGICSFIRLHSR